MQCDHTGKVTKCDKKQSVCRLNNPLVLSVLLMDIIPSKCNVKGNSGASFS